MAKGGEMTMPIKEARVGIYPTYTGEVDQRLRVSPDFMIELPVDGGSILVASVILGQTVAYSRVATKDGSVNDGGVRKRGSSGATWEEALLGLESWIGAQIRPEMERRISPETPLNEALDGLGPTATRIILEARGIG